MLFDTDLPAGRSWNCEYRKTWYATGQLSPTCEYAMSIDGPGLVIFSFTASTPGESQTDNYYYNCADAAWYHQCTWHRGSEIGQSKLKRLQRGVLGYIYLSDSWQVNEALAHFDNIADVVVITTNSAEDELRERKRTNRDRKLKYLVGSLCTVYGASAVLTEAEKNIRSTW